MSIGIRTLAAAALAASIAPLSNSALATPITGAIEIHNSAPTNVEDVGWRRGWGWGVGAGIIGGALIGRALSEPYYYGPYYEGPYYDERPYYPAPAYRYYSSRPYDEDDEFAGNGPVQDDAVAYCMQRFRSYDPSSGTYLGYDGLRHPCP
jgi:hypothetical protein